MLNLLRMDLRHLYRSKSIYICFGILAFTSVLTFGIFYILSNPEIQEFLLQHGATITATSGEVKEVLGTTSLLSLYHQTNISGGFFPVVISILMSLFICTDFDSGFIKNIMAVHENKWEYILSKLASISVINLMSLAGTYAITLVLNLIFGNLFHYASAADTLFYLFSVWMVTNGFCALTLLICMITRSKAAGAASAFVLCSGLIVVILQSLLGLFGAGEIMNYSLYMNLATCPLKYQGPESLRPIIVSVVFFIIYTVISKLILAKKDI